MIDAMRHAIFGAVMALGLALVSSGPAWAVSLKDVDTYLTGAALVEGTDKPVAPFKGQVVVVTFFASWCPPCRNEFKHLNHLIERVGEDRITVIGINQFEAWGGKKNPARMARFLADTTPRFALIEGSETLRVAFGDIERIPSVIVIGTNGKEAWRFVHERGSNKTHATIDDLTSVLTAAGVSVASQ